MMIGDFVWDVDFDFDLCGFVFGYSWLWLFDFYSQWFLYYGCDFDFVLDQV